MDGQQELLPEPTQQHPDIAEVAAKIGAVAGSRPHEPVPTDTDVRREAMEELRGEDLAAEQGARPPLGLVPKRSFRGAPNFSQTRAALERSTRRPRV